MTKRTHTANVLAVYFEEKGHILSLHEYKQQEDAPIRPAIIKKTFGSWNRMENIVRGFNIRNQKRSDFEATSDVDDVINRNAQVEAEYAEKMKAASENLEAKTAREEAARQYIEADKLRAATAEGAYENKMRKGGVTSQDEKAKKEAVEQALAVEHAMLAQTGAGSALGKELLGGVEDNDEKVRVIAEQNAMRTKTKLMAATPLGAAEAKLIEDDTDGQLTREAQARIRNELRTFVPPVQEGDAQKAESNATKKVRDEVREVVKAAAGDENVMTSSVFKASAARAKVAHNVDQPVDITEIPEDVMRTMPPASQLPADGFEGAPTEIKDKDGKVRATVDNTDEEEDGDTPASDTSKTNLDNKINEKNAKGREEAKKLSEGEKKANEKNPAAPPATRNPDPKVAPTADPESGDKKQNNNGAAKPAAKETKPADKK
jgi:hypothetical protein